MAKHAEMTQGFSAPGGKPVAVCCLKQTLATGDFHQLLWFAFKGTIFLLILLISSS